MKKSKNQQLANKWLWLGAVLFLAVITRFWQVSELFHYTLDEEYWSYTAHNVATGYHLPLIGGPIGGTGLYLGPVFVWITGLIFWIINSNPFVLAYLMAGMGVLVVGLIFGLLKKFVGDKAALLAALLYASSTLMVIYDKKYWNASPMPLLAVLSLYLVERLRRQPQMWLSVSLGLVATVAVQAHMSGLTIVIFSLIALILYKIPRKLITVYIAILIITHLPIVAFEIRHDWVNTQAFFELLNKSETTSSVRRYDQLVQLPVATLARLLYTPATDISNELTLCTQMANTRAMPQVIYWLFAVVIWLYAATQLKYKNPYALLVAVNLVLIAVYMSLSPENFYPGQLSEYYLLPSVVALSVLTAQLSLLIWKRWPVAIAVIWLMLIIANFHVITHLKHSQSLVAKHQTVQTAISQLEGRPFYLDVVGHPCQVYGYRFLFTWLGVEPSADYLGPNFAWLYERRLPQSEAEIVVEIDADTNSSNVKMQN